MEERLYGYYPATYQTQALQARRKYNNECLYKFRDTMYDTKAAIPNAPSMAVHGYSMLSPSGSCTPPSAGSRCSSRSQSMPRTKSAPIPRFKLAPRLNIPTPFQVWNDSTTVSPTPYRLESSRPPSVSSSQVSWQLPKGIREPKVRPASPAAPLHERIDQSKVDWPRPKSKVDTPDVARLTPASSRIIIAPASSRSRIHSASTSRDKIPVPVRAIKSAGVSRIARGSTAECLQYEVHHTPASRPHAPHPHHHTYPPPPATTLLPAPPAPTPPSPKQPVHEEEEELEEDQESQEAREKSDVTADVHPEGCNSETSQVPPRAVKSSSSESLQAEGHHIPASSPPRTHSPPAATSPPLPPPHRPKKPVHEEEEFPEALEWEEAREKYGWLAEVHGNPYGYKKIAKRLPYYVKCAEPVLDPEPPSAQSENVSTFFYNSIPRRGNAFTIHQEWMSESLHLKRMAHQKKHGTTFRWRNFGFVY